MINGVLVPGMPIDNFSARFVSIQNFVPGRYDFYAASDDGVRLYINGALVLDKFVARTLTTDTISVWIAVTPVTLVIEYFEGSGQSILQFQWFPSGNQSTPTPLPTFTPTPSVPTRNFFETHTIPLSWNRVSWAAGYRIQIASDRSFKNIVWDENTLTALTLNVTTPYLNNGHYYWRVKAKVNPTAWGGWSAADEFTVSAYDFGTNWTGWFFSTTDLTGNGVGVAGIQGLDFDWGTGVPVINGAAVQGIPADNFSARFTSIQNFTPGQYSFVVSSDDGVRLYVNGELVLDKFVGRELTTDTVLVSITTNPANLTVEYFEGTNQAKLQIKWR